MPTAPPTGKKSGAKQPLISSSGQALARPAAFQLALDPTLDQRSFFAQCAGARRFTFNHHLGRVKQILDVRAGEREAKLAASS